MKFNRLVLLSTVVAIPLMLIGCDYPPDETDIILKGCEASEDGVSCEEVGVRMRWHMQMQSVGGKLEYSSGSSTMQSSTPDAALAGIDFSASSSEVFLTTASGHVVIKITTLDGSVATNAFSWSVSNDYLSADNPSAINSWISQYDGNIDKMDLDFGSVSATSGTGANTLSAEAMYDGQVQAGDAYAWYVDSGDCDVSDCQQQ